MNNLLLTILYQLQLFFHVDMVYRNLLRFHKFLADMADKRRWYHKYNTDQLDTVLKFVDIINVNNEYSKLY